MIDLTGGNGTTFLIVIIVLTIAIFLRYVLLAGIFYYLFNVRGYWPDRRLSFKSIKKNQIKREVGFSLISSFIFALLGTWLYWRWQTGGRGYDVDFSLADFFWIILGLVMILILHETYYYWLHRWMHRPEIYKFVHKAHHESLTTTAWTSFSFHPIESFLQGLPIFVMFYYIPFHVFSLVLALIIMAVTSVINHLNTEMYSKQMARHWLARWWIGATHHHLHHHQFKYNYGLYFTFWDHWMKTESPDYQKLLGEKTKSGNTCI